MDSSAGNFLDFLNNVKLVIYFYTTGNPSDDLPPHYIQIGINKKGAWVYAVIDDASLASLEVIYIDGQNKVYAFDEFTWNMEWKGYDVSEKYSILCGKLVDMVFEDDMNM